MSGDPLELALPSELDLEVALGRGRESCKLCALWLKSAQQCQDLFTVSARNVASSRLAP
jgi:hypothetical protein